MRRALRLLLTLCGAAVLLMACETAPVTGRSQIMLVSENEERRMGDLVELMRSSNVIEVGAAKALLEAHGVTAHLFDAHGSAVLGSLPGVNVRLLVPRSDIERSLEILRSTPESGSGEKFA